MISKPVNIHAEEKLQTWRFIMGNTTLKCHKTNESMNEFHNFV